jgi:hypothetical protein
MPPIHEPQTMLKSGLATQKTLVELLASCVMRDFLTHPWPALTGICGQSCQSSSRNYPRRQRSRSVATSFSTYQSRFGNRGVIRCAFIQFE